MGKDDLVERHESEHKSAFSFVMDQTSVSTQLRNLFFPLWNYTMLTGDTNLNPLALAILTETHWEWGHHHKWFEVFAEDKQWPYMWRQDRSNYPHMVRYSATQQMRKARVELLAHYLFGVTANVMRFERSRGYLRKRGIDVYPVQDCPIEYSVARDFAEFVNPDDWTTWPPYFPGDRNSISLKRELQATTAQS